MTNPYKRIQDLEVELENYRRNEKMQKAGIQRLQKLLQGQRRPGGVVVDIAADRIETLEATIKLANIPQVTIDAAALSNVLYKDAKLAEGPTSDLVSRVVERIEELETAIGPLINSLMMALDELAPFSRTDHAEICMQGRKAISLAYKILDSD